MKALAPIAAFVFLALAVYFVVRPRGLADDPHALTDSFALGFAVLAGLYIAITAEEWGK